MDRESKLREAVQRAYAAAGVYIRERDAASLASVYATWSEAADDGVIDRIERALAGSLGLPGPLGRSG